MTRGRYEIEFQGSDDGQTWLIYPFRFKPQDPAKAREFMRRISRASIEFVVCFAEFVRQEPIMVPRNRVCFAAMAMRYCSCGQSVPAWSTTSSARCYLAILVHNAS